MMRVICVFSVFPVVGSFMLAWFVVTSLIFVLFPRRLLVFVFVSPSVVCVGNEPFSYRRLVLFAFFLPPDGFFLCWSACHTDIVCVVLLCVAMLVYLVVI